MGIPSFIGLPEDSRVIGAHVIYVCLPSVETLMRSSSLCRDLDVFDIRNSFIVLVMLESDLLGKA